MPPPWGDSTAVTETWGHAWEALTLLQISFDGDRTEDWREGRGKSKQTNLGTKARSSKKGREVL